MHPNPAFRGTQAARSQAFAHERGFGCLCVNGPDGPMISHVPYLLESGGTAADLHLVRSNPIARAVGAGCPAVMVVSGPDSYISPDWYGAADQVPTWNYVAVHLRGTLEALPQDALGEMLERQSGHFETLLAPKPAWTTDKMSPGVMERMMRAIAPFRLRIEDLQSTWKLGQNKPDEARLAAAREVAETGKGQEVAALSLLMTLPPEMG